MSWLDDLASQLSDSTQNGDSPADAVPSDPATSDTFNAAKDSSDASKFFSAFFGGNNAGTDTARPDASAADYRNGSDMQSDASPSESVVAQAKPSMSMLDGILNKINLKHTADGSIDYSDPSTIDKVLKLVMAGGNVMSALMNRGQPQGYKTASQLQAEIKSPLSSWTPSQQATANSFFGQQLQGPSHQLAFAANMPNPIVPGKGYAAGGAIPPTTSMSYNNGQWAPTPTAASGYNPNYTPPSASSMGDWMNGTRALGQQHTDLGYLDTLEKASMANTGHALTMDQYTGLWGQDPSAVMSRLGWNAPGAGSTAGAGFSPSSVAGGLSGMQGAFGAAAGMAGSNPGIDANPNPSVIGGGYSGGGFPTQMPAGSAPMQQTPTTGPAGPMPVGLNGVSMNQLQAARRAGYDPGSAFAQYWQQQPGKHGGMRFDMHAASDAFGLRGGPGQGGANQGPPPHVLPPQSAPASGNPVGPQVGLPPLTTPAGSMGALGSVMVPWTTNSPSAAAYGPQRLYRGGRVAGFGRGGALGHVMANTGGQDDVVPIRAAGGEYMFDAATVSDLGDGNNAAGAKKLDAMRENIRTHKRSAPVNKIPPKAKQPMQYMKKGA